MHESHAGLKAPGIQEVDFRPFRGAMDFPAMIAVREACRERDRVDIHSAREGIPTVAGLDHAYADLEPGAPNWLFAEVDGTVIGYAAVRWWTETGPLEVYLHLGWVVPTWRRRGIGRILLSWAQQHCREIHAQRAPDHPATWATNCSSTQTDAIRLIQHEGYKLIHEVSDMVCADLPQLYPISALPEGLTMKPLLLEEMRHLYAVYKDAWRGLWGETPETEADYQDFFADNVQTPLFDSSLWQVAWEGEEVVGFVIALLDEGVGKFPEVAVRKRWQRRGLGTALMSRAMHLLREREAFQLRLYTNAENPVGAKTLYERLGFREVKRHGFYRNPF